MRFASSFALFACAVTSQAFVSHCFAQDWPQWRGPANDGNSTAKGVPTKWSAEENVAWKVKLPGMGGSTPILVGDQIFLTSAAGERLVLLALSTKDGKEIWRADLGKGIPLARVDEGNGAASSPSSDGKHIFSMSGSGDFAAFTLEGKEVWRFNLQERYGKFKIQFGTTTTPVLDGDRLYIQLLDDQGQRVIALETATGKEAWKAQRPSDGTDENLHSYASAFLWSNGSEKLLITHGNDYTVAHNLGDGSEVWRVSGLNPKDKYNRYLRFVASPVTAPEIVVIPTAKKGQVVGIKPVTKDGKPAFEELWRMPKNTPDVSCPLVYQNLVYLCGEQGSITVVDARKGTELYSQRIHAARYRSSPVRAEDNVYLAGRDGVVTVVKTGPEYTKVAENKVPDQIAASPVVTNGRIYLRGYDYLWAIGK